MVFALGALALAVLILMAAGRQRAEDNSRLPTSGESATGSPPVIQDADPAGSRATLSASRENPHEDKTNLPRDVELNVTLTVGQRPADGGRVRLRQQGHATSWEADVDRASGVASFRSLQAGTYQVEFAELPVGALPPRTQHRRSRSVPILAEARLGSNQLTIDLEPSARIFGYVRDASGGLVDRAIVRFTSLDTRPTQFVSPVELGVRSGHYEGDVYCGPWRIEVLPDIQGQPLLDPLPVPQVHDLGPGSQTQIDFSYQPMGTCVLNIIVHDTQGNGFSGLHAFLYRIHNILDSHTGGFRTIVQGVQGGTQLSDESGEVTWRGLPPGHYRVMVEPEGFNPEAPPGESVLGSPIPTRDLDIASDTPTRIEITAPRSDPVLCQGQIVVDSTWAKSHPLVSHHPTVQLILGRNEWRKRDRVSDVALTSDDSFQFYLDNAEANALLQITVGAEVMTYPLTLSSWGRGIPAVIRFPE